MKTLKKTLISLFFCCELLIFIFLYAFGTHGLQAIYSLRLENEKAYSENNKLKEKIKEKERACSMFQVPFYKEKIAREQLQMAHKDDIVYIVR